MSYTPSLPPHPTEEQIYAELLFMDQLAGQLSEQSPEDRIQKAHLDHEVHKLTLLLHGPAQQAKQHTQSVDPQSRGYTSNRVGESSGDSPGDGTASSASSLLGSGLPSPRARVQSLPRKRNHDFDFPESKRASPVTPGSPASQNFIEALSNNHNHIPMPFRTSGSSRQVTYSSEPQGVAAQLGMPGPANIIDLTGDDDDDPFPELHQAYRQNEQLPFMPVNQNYMSQGDLVDFLQPLTGPATNSLGYSSALYVSSSAPNANRLPFFGNSSIVQNPASTLNYSSNSQSGYSSYKLEQDSFGGGGAPLLHTEANTEANSDAIANLIENIKPDDDVPKHLREQTPRAMCDDSQLMEHQKLGLTWLRRMEEGTNKGGILADEMGLGKTIQALALILARPSKDGTCKTTLIIAPVALMRQWEKELERHVRPNHRLKVYIYHGSGKNADFGKLRQYDVVLTTFGTLSSEMKQKESRREAQFVQQEHEDNTFTRRKKDKLALLGPECKWYRVIIDEAQCIKNKSTLSSKAATDLQAIYRLCMTGTPMMNSLDELYPLIRFLHIKPLNDWARFSDRISKPMKDKREWRREGGMTRVHGLLKSMMLRRTKTTKVDGEEICKIPPKFTHHDSVIFSDAEDEFYKAIQSKSQLRFNRYLENNQVTRNYASILVELLRLRQACCHPHLIKDFDTQVATEGMTEQDLLDRAHSLSMEVVNRLKLIDNFDCPICLDAALNPTIFIPCGHTCCGECFQKLMDPSQAIREGNESGSAKCPHCRSALSPNAITDFKHFCEVYAPEKVLPSESDEDQKDGDSDSDSGSDSGDEDMGFEGDDLDGFVVPDDVEDDFEPLPSENTSSGQTHRSKKTKSKGKGKAKPKVTLAQLKKESLRNAQAKRKYLKRLRKNFVSSSKIDKTVELIQEIQQKDPTEKILIFSQFTSLLDLLEIPLVDRGYKYQRYDGSMKMDDRADAVNKFMDEADQQIMLISLKAGNAGLNLNKASQVIMLDPFWNPYVEDQAVDRAHRMPQMREVHVHRLLVPETVEDRICELQDKKRDLISAALDEKEHKSVSRLSINDLKYLFGLARSA